MGMSMVPAYILISSIACPALMDMGLSRLVSHLIIMWFALASMWTPPVAISAFVASSIAHESPFKISFKSVPMGMGLYVIPFMMAYGKLITGTFPEMLLTAFCGAFALTAVGAAVVGYTNYKVSVIERILMCAVAALLLMQQPLFIMIGFAGFAVIWGNRFRISRRMKLNGTFVE